MLKYEFEKDLLEALEKALQGTDAIAAYVFNLIEPVIEKHAVEQSVQRIGGTQTTESNVEETAESRH